MRIIALDVGTKTIGVAVSDELGWTAQGIETIKIDVDKNDYGLERIAHFVNEYQPEKFVVGFPKNMNGTIGPRGEACAQFAELIKDTFNTPVILWDERLSTMAAERILLSGDVSRKKRKKVIDKMAAVMILQGYLDSQK
ncbi:Holliday junction resolvase RuvX [Calidifontibacillus oryziterrae]|uniref:Holliday junction resolvase RuvX n=1 Tax=Calidifontibacillus oryziterrae TaxID=1191699 RepID=UPI0002D444F9|nr:Holliday junction resolvase RuvX [Calidifontibacillus oryziterrae]